MSAHGLASRSRPFVSFFSYVSTDLARRCPPVAPGIKVEAEEFGMEDQYGLAGGQNSNEVRVGGEGGRRGGRREEGMGEQAWHVASSFSGAHAWGERAPPPAA